MCSLRSLLTRFSEVCDRHEIKPILGLAFDVQPFDPYFVLNMCSNIICYIYQYINIQNISQVMKLDLAQDGGQSSASPLCVGPMCDYQLHPGQIYLIDKHC